MKKDIEWLYKSIEELPLAYLGFSVLKNKGEYGVPKDEVLSLINQLDEPEVLSQEWIDKHKREYDEYPSGAPVLLVDDVKNLLVPKQEPTEEPETVANVLDDFFKSANRAREVLNMEVDTND